MTSIYIPIYSYSKIVCLVLLNIWSCIQGNHKLGKVDNFKYDTLIFSFWKYNVFGKYKTVKKTIICLKRTVSI